MSEERVWLLNQRFEPHVGGVENSLRELALALRAAGHQVRIIASDSAPPGLTRPPATGEAYGAALHRYRLASGWAQPFGILRAARLLRQLRQREEPTVLVARHHTSVVALRAAGFGRVTYVVPTLTEGIAATLGGLAPSPHAGTRSRSWARMSLQRWALLQAERLVVLSENMARQLRGVGVAAARIEVASPGVNTDRFSPLAATPQQALRKELGWPADRPVALSFGRMVPEKGFDLMLAAAAHLPPEWLVVFAGDGPASEPLRRASETAPARVRWLPGTATPEVLLRAADVFVLPSRYEPFGQVLLEAVATGVPVVAFTASSGAVTANEEIFAGSPGLWAPVSTMTPAALAAGVVRGLRLPAVPAYGVERAAFLKRFRWASLMEVLLRSGVRR